MRPVNLIPSEERRGKAAGTRNIGVYALIGALVLVLVAVSAITLFDKKASDRQVELDSLQSQVDAAQAQAASFSSFTSFQQVHDARLATIDSLAKSRFDWERVMRELSIVIPDRVFLTNLTGTVSPSVTVTSGAGLDLRGQIPGPALEVTGCAQNQRTVARLIAAMHDIDGVGRVLVSNSSKAVPTEDSGAGGAVPSDAAAVAGCDSQPDYPTFELVAALDGVPVTATAPAPTTGVPTSATTPAATTGTTTTPAATTTTPATTTPTTSTTATDGGVTETNDQAAQQQTEIAAAQQSTDNASQIPTGGGK